MRVLLYNGNVDLFTEVHITFEFSLGGRIEKTVKVTSQQIRNPYDFSTDNDRLMEDSFRCALELLFLAVLSYMTINLASNAWNQGSAKFFASPENWLNLVGQAMYIVNVALWITCATAASDFYLPGRITCAFPPRPAPLSSVRRTCALPHPHPLQHSTRSPDCKFLTRFRCAPRALRLLFSFAPPPPPDTKKYGESYDSLDYIYEQFATLRYKFDQYRMTNSVSIILNIVRLFLFMGFHGRLGLVTKTLERVWKDLYHFFILFFFSVAMLAFMGWNLLGADSPVFRTYEWSFQSIMMMAIGELPDWEEDIYRKNQNFGTSITKRRKLGKEGKKRRETKRIDCTAL